MQIGLLNHNELPRDRPMVEQSGVNEENSQTNQLISIYFLRVEMLEKTFEKNCISYQVEAKDYYWNFSHIFPKENVRSESYQNENQRVDEQNVLDAC